eukprot:9287958-Pyramimonas_sp.AAC.2
MGGRAAGKSALGSWGLGTRGCSAVCECERAEGEGQPSAIGETFLEEERTAATRVPAADGLEVYKPQVYRRVARGEGSTWTYDGARNESAGESNSRAIRRLNEV